MRFTYVLIVLFWLSSFLQTQAQTPDRWTSAEIYEALQRLEVLGSVLYVAAHPDDENTSMISYFSNQRKARTAYLSLTRGDGGQNLIGPELQELLGVIRTQELLAARRIDGGEQFFTRANDFGYSKHPDETLQIWNKEEVLADVVWAIRRFKPDVIINRFDHESAGRTHGHHTSSAVLSYEAFDLAGDPKVFPEQLEYVDPWQPRRLFFNTSWWFYGSREAFEKADKSRMLEINAGVYYPLKGKSNTEIAAASRSMHKCQGMGRTPTRGFLTEYLELLKGDMPVSKREIFEDIDVSWNRLEDGARIGQMVEKIRLTFDFENPAGSVPDLLQTYALIQELEDSHWKEIKLEEIKDILRACLGMYIDAAAEDYSATQGEEVEVNFEIINRSPLDVQLQKIELLPTGQDTLIQAKLANNENLALEMTFTVPENLSYTSPYWLNEPHDLGMYTVKDQRLRGLPETPRAIQAQFYLDVAGTEISWTEDVVYKSTDPVDGEVFRPFEILPPVFANITEPVFVYGNDAPKTVEVKLKAGKADLTGTLRLDLPDGWNLQPESAEFEMELKNEEKTIRFELYPPAEASEGDIRAVVETPEGIFDKAVVLIEYDHIPTQTVLMPSRAKVVRVELQKAGNRVGYLMGAGDEIPASLRQIGYQVDLLEDEDINLSKLSQYDAVILGIRAYNTVERMQFYHPVLLQYAEEGGTLIVQYNTTWRLPFPAEEIAPFPMKLSRDRVSLETAEVRILKPDHPVLNFPNKITEKDFDNWVQERGLYFPNEWEAPFEAILSSNDPGESPKDGGLLIAPYGKGYYIYSGYSWFRELPAGVSGAYRLFTNMISIGQKDPKP